MNVHSPLFRTLSILALILLGVISLSFVLHLSGRKESESTFLLLFVSRIQWGAVTATRPAVLLPIRPPPYVIISHTATDFCLDTAKCIGAIRNIQDYHMKSLHWNDIGYNFLVGGDGMIYEARGWDVQGAHTKNYNEKSIGVSFIGTFTKLEPTDVQVYAAKKLIEYALQTGRLAEDYKLLGHRQCTKTESPGQKLYDIIKTWPHWSNKTDLGESYILGVPYAERRKWIARPPFAPANKLEIFPPKYVIISHTATEFCYDRSECIRNIRFIQNLHMESQGWDDIAYNFLVGGDGAIYEGRGWDVEGAHTFNYNIKSIGISFVGTFTKFRPTDIQLYAAEKLIEYALQTGRLAEDYKLLGHRQCIKTESPGRKLYDIIKTWPHWSPTP